MSYIFINALGISELLSRILAACGSVDYLIFACLAYFVIERYGRRRVMMCSAAACSICWICIAIALGLSENGGNSYVLGSVAVAFFFMFFASFGLGVLGIPWLYPSEVNALTVRAKGDTRKTLSLARPFTYTSQVPVWRWQLIGSAYVVS